MDESYTCECGGFSFTFFGCFVQCQKCANEYKHTGPKGRREYWLRRYNRLTSGYGNWEHITSNLFKESE